MKNIEKLTIKNFQSHQDSVLSFDPGVNVIIGSSDSGKSAILRAINLVIKNEPRGTSYIRLGCKEALISIKTGENLITRIRSKKDNIYKLNNQEFRAFSQAVPLPISEVLNCPDINISRQLDAPFLLSLSPGDIAKKLNEIANLDLIDSSLSAINSLIKATKNESDRVTNKSEELKVQNESFNWLADAAEEIRIIEELNTELDGLNNKYQELYTITQKIKKLKEAGAYMLNLADLEKTCFLIEKKQKNYDKMKERYSKLTNITNNIQRKQSDLAILVLEIQKNEEILKDNLQDFCPLCGQQITTNNIGCSGQPMGNSSSPNYNFSVSESGKRFN